MPTFTRLFELLDQYAKRFPDKPMLHAKIGGEWTGKSATEVRKQSRQLAAALLRLGVSGHDLSPEQQHKVSVLSNNRPEWIITDFAVQQTGAVLVPIYPSISTIELAYILNESRVEVLFISDKHLYKKIQAIRAEVPHLKHLYSYDRIEGVAHWTELLCETTERDEAQIETIRASIQPEHLATIIYTSGTTGNPKGVMLSHHNIMSNVDSSMEAFSFCNAEENVLSFLPLNHIFERTVMYIYINKGVSIFFAEGMETIGNDLREVRPVAFTTVPRLLEKVYEKIDAKGSQLSGMKRRIFDWAVNLAMAFEINSPRSAWYRMQLALADRLVYSKWREAVGGRIKAIVTGSAACQVKLQRLFTASKMIVMEGYGLTETSPVISVNRFEEKNRAFGTVGTVIRDVEVRIAEDGEIVCRGPNIMMGYYKHPELTDEVIKDGWFHTGDIGEFLEGKFLKITDRKKEIFKLSAGKYIAPMAIENKMKESPFIEQMMVVGSNEKFAGALIVPAFDKIREYLNRLNIATSHDEDLTVHKDVLKLIRSELDRFNKLFAAHEHVKKFQLLHREWTIDGGELTPTLKLKRRKIMEKYGYLVEKIYA